MNLETLADPQSLPLVVGVDLGGTQIRVAVLCGAVLLSRVSLFTGENAIPDRIIPCIYRAIQQALDQADTSFDQIAGIGIGVPGPIDRRAGMIFALPNLSGWDDVPLQAIFKEHYNIPIFVENDANAGALGEYMFGAGRGCKDMVYLTIGTGIGGGIIAKGQIMGGASGTAAELGHMTIDWRGRLCHCGNIGCLESIASGNAIARRANEAIRDGLGSELLAWTTIQADCDVILPKQSAVLVHETDTAKDSDQQIYLDAQTVARAAEMGVPLARTIIMDAAQAIGFALVNIIHLFNPEVIILGGGVTRIGPLLIEPALQVVQDHAMKVLRKSVRILQAQLGVDAGLVGAGALILH